jgi:hypothetical protein
LLWIQEGNFTFLYFIIGQSLPTYRQQIRRQSGRAPVGNPVFNGEPRLPFLKPPAHKKSTPLGVLKETFSTISDY